MHGDGFGCLHTEDISGHVSSCSRSFFRPFISRFVLLAFFLSSFYLAFLPARVFFFFVLAFFLFFRPARVFFFVLLAFFLSSFYLAFRPARVLFLPAHVLFFFLLAFFRPFISRFFLLEFIFLNKSPSKICIYQKFVVPLHSNLNTLVRD